MPAIQHRATVIQHTATAIEHTAAAIEHTAAATEHTATAREHWQYVKLYTQNGIKRVTFLEDDILRHQSFYFKHWNHKNKRFLFVLFVVDNRFWRNKDK